MASPALVWFRDDFRLGDNPALAAAAESGSPLLFFAVLDETSPGLRPLGGAARWWLHGSLQALGDALKAQGAELLLLRGPAGVLVERLARTTGAQAVYWNRRYTAAEIAVDSALETSLAARGVAVRTFNGRLLHEPWEITNRSGRPFQVFTPYLRSVMSRAVPRPLPAPARIRPGAWPAGIADLQPRSLADLKLEPSRPDWAKAFAASWSRGEAAARRKLDDFADDGLAGYARRRDFPGAAGTSRLSPHLRFGEISPRQLWHAVMARGNGLEADAQKFLAELVWRDFCHQLLYCHPHLPDGPHAERFERFPWVEDGPGLAAWQRGRTGYPIVDAGMRQLWTTGWMHNRVRMIAASFLVKHLLIDWRRGETWFWDTLVDADAANNAFSWQWIAGSGPDSAPFHRIFNPVGQGERFDPRGDYVRTHVPELARLPAAFVHRPWEAPPEVLESAGVVLGETYPGPVVAHGAARERALRAFRSLRGESA